MKYEHIREEMEVYRKNGPFKEEKKCVYCNAKVFHGLFCLTCQKMLWEELQNKKFKDFLDEARGGII